MRRPTRNISPQAINGRCLQCGYRLVWTSCEAEGRRWGSALLVVHHTKTRCVAAWREKGGSQCSKLHSSRLCRAGLFVHVVAQPIQDMSAVSITYKTLGIGLPRLWCRPIR